MEGGPGGDGGGFVVGEADAVEGVELEVGAEEGEGVVGGEDVVVEGVLVRMWSRVCSGFSSRRLGAARAWVA